MLWNCKLCIGKQGNQKDDKLSLGILRRWMEDEGGYLIDNSDIWMLYKIFGYFFTN